MGQMRREVASLIPKSWPLSPPMRPGDVPADAFNEEAWRVVRGRASTAAHCRQDGQPMGVRRPVGELSLAQRDGDTLDHLPDHGAEAANRE